MNIKTVSKLLLSILLIISSSTFGMFSSIGDLAYPEYSNSFEESTDTKGAFDNYSDFDDNYIVESSDDKPKKGWNLLSNASLETIHELNKELKPGKDNNIASHIKTITQDTIDSINKQIGNNETIMENAEQLTQNIVNGINAQLGGKETILENAEEISTIIVSHINKQIGNNETIMENAEQLTQKIVNGINAQLGGKETILETAEEIATIIVEHINAQLGGKETAMENAELLTQKIVTSLNEEFGYSDGKLANNLKNTITSSLQRSSKNIFKHIFLCGASLTATFFTCLFGYKYFSQKYIFNQ